MKQIVKKYLVIADYVISKNDRDRHFITCTQLMQLYSVHEEECLCIDSRLPQLISHYHSRYPDLIELRPRFDGDYIMPTILTKT